MGRKSKVSYEVKLKAVLEYKDGNKSHYTLAKEYGVGRTSIQRWIMIYDSQGADGLKETHHNKSWSRDIKLSAVNEYLSGNDSLSDICKKYKISHDSILKRWIMVYNDSHKKLRSIRSGGNRIMTKGRKVTFDEKVEIVQYCIANGRDYYATMKKYQISYQQIYSWLRKYDKGGIDALVDRRGKAKPENKLTDTGRLRIENKMLEAKNMELEMEIRLLKKLQEIERRRY